MIPNCCSFRSPATKSVHLKVSRSSRFSGRLSPMHPNPILHEAEQLHLVSERLDLLAGQHPIVSEALISISGSVRNTATLLEVLVATKMTSLFGTDPANA
jgi:hypothetical protein